MILIHYKISVSYDDAQQYTPNSEEARPGVRCLAGRQGPGLMALPRRRPVLGQAYRAMYRLARPTAAAQAPKGIVMPRLPEGYLVRKLFPVAQSGRLYLIGIPGEEPNLHLKSRGRLRSASIVGADLADVLCVGTTNAVIT